MLRNSENRTLRLTTEQKGRFTNVVDVEPVESAPSRTSGKTAEEKDTECRLKTFTTAYAKDLAVAGKIPTDSILGWSELFYRYLRGEISVSDDDLNEVLRKARSMEEQSASRVASRKPSATRTMEGITP
jgi:hypothetical protein